MPKKCVSCGVENRDEANYCMSCGTSLIARPPVAPPPAARVVRPAGPVPPMAPARIPAPGSCFYHPNMFASYICRRCGRGICRACARFYGGMVLCPQCYVFPPYPAPWYPYPVTMPPYGYPPGPPFR